jgi:OmpA family
MAGENSGTVHRATDKGTVASHPEVDAQPFFVAPTVAQAFNVLALDINAVACLSLHDVLFAFDSSCVNPEAETILKELPGLRERHKSKLGEFPPVTVFGHADPVGTDSYNKTLSGRRARTIFGLLLHDSAIWEDLYTHPFQGDRWKGPQIAAMLDALGYKADADDGLLNTPDDPNSHYFVNNKSAVVEKFQTDKGIGHDGYLNASTRKPIFEGYMQKLSAAKLVKTDFLGHGADPDGVGDLQGCSDFNPLLLLSRNENNALAHPARNQANQPNRRVVIFLMCPGRKINIKRWPCPSWSAPSAGCKKRFFSDGEKRRAPAADERREFAKTHDTFACRFYDRVARLSPCETPAPPVTLLLRLVKVDKYFAPSVESLDIKYDIGALSGRTVKLRIQGDNYTGKTCFERDLTAAEKTDGSGKPLTWDGKCTVGDRKDKFATPLIGPYKVQLFVDPPDAALKGELPFEILYHSIELKLGDFTKGIFDNAADTNKGDRERLKALGYFYGDVTADDAANDEFKKAVEWFQTEHDAAAAPKGTVAATTRTAIADRLPFMIEGGAVPADDADKKIFVSGAFFINGDAQLNAADPGNFRFTTERDFWKDGLQIPIYAKILLKKKDDSKGDAPAAVGPVKVFFEWEDVPDNAALAGMQNDYISKARDYFKDTTNPKGVACHKDRGGKRGDDILKVFPKNTDTAKFPFAVDKGGIRDWAAVSTAREDAGTEQGFAGVIFRPSRMGGDGYIVHAYLHHLKDLDTAAEKATAPEVETKTGKMRVWRRVRLNQYLHKPNAGINAINFATVNVEMAKAHMEFTDKFDPIDITEADWNAKVTAALTSDPDFATIGVVSYASLNTIDFKSYADYRTAAGAGALPAAAYTALCRGKMDGWLTRIISEFAKNQFHGMTVMRVANGHSAYFTNSGVASGGGCCYVFWPKATYDAKGYVVEKYGAHEMGHCLFLRHHYAANRAPNPDGTLPASDNPKDHHDKDVACAMSYYQTAWHFCGKCLLKLRGWDEAALKPVEDDNKKP